MSTEALVFNGINGASGDYLFPAMTPEEISKIARGEEPVMDKKLFEELEWYKNNKEDHYGLKPGKDPRKLSEAGWGVIFAQDADPEIKKALRELLAYRKEQAGELYKEYTEDDGYHYNIEEEAFESKLDFLAKHGAGPGPVDPKKVPYYLLIVGDPETIPYSFQYQLDVQYAVGRLHFDGPDKLDQYARYARSVVEAEQGKLVLPRQATFFGVRNQDDSATNLSADYLVKPLAEKITQEHTDWFVQTFLGADQAKKAQLAKLLGGEQTPALLFTASHGMGFPGNHGLQLSHQGALLCQDWPGPKEWQGQGPITPDYYFSADDVDDNARLWGMIAFHFACFGGGTPRLDDFAHLNFWNAASIAPHAFVARLPQRLLSHPQGGALAVVGHVDRAWGYSFTWEEAGPQLGTFESTLQQLLEGLPIGAAIEYFNERYAELSTEITKRILDVKTKKRGSEVALSGVWTANNDARSYVIIGDPAVRLPVGKDKTSEKPRATMTPVEIRTKRTFGLSLESTPTTERTAIPTPAEPSPESAPKAESAEAAEYGILSDALDQTRAKLTNAFKTLVDKLSKAVDDVTSVEVTTYVSDDMNEVAAGQFTEKTRLRALTRIEIDGDAKLVVPTKKEELDQELWKIHSDMVKQAQDRQVKLAETLISAAASVVNILKGL